MNQKQYPPELTIQRKYTVGSQETWKQEHKPGQVSAVKTTGVEHSASESFCDMRHAHWNEIFLQNKEF